MRFIFSVLLVSGGYFSFAQECNCPGKDKKPKGSFYFLWGYNREIYSLSDIHFRNSAENYNFVLTNLKATDSPDFYAIPSVDISIPQYNYRIGYYFGKYSNAGIELNFDHAKYVVYDQLAHITGQVHGIYMDKDTLLNENYFHFEHTDGANFLMLNFLRKKSLFCRPRHTLYAVLKPGIGMLIPRTDVTIFGKEVNNCFHIAGEIYGLETGLRYEFLKHGLVEFTGKGAFANYRNVLVISEGKAWHHFWALEGILTLGYQF